MPTGTVFNSHAGVANGKQFTGDVFLFATEDGTISGWNGGLMPITQAVVVFGVADSGSIYKGLAVHGDTLYTTDFAECKVEAIDGNRGG